MDNLQYMAGFFDGEGSIGIYRSSVKTTENYYLRTQLTQNTSEDFLKFLKPFINYYGGNLSKCKTLSGKIKYNWQLSSIQAIKFLEDLVPYLILKKSQAILALKWIKQKPKPSRDNKGRIQSSKYKNIKLDKEISELMKILKETEKSISIEIVMANQSDLVEIVAEIKQVLCVKG